MNTNKLVIDILSLMTFLQENGLLKKIGGIQVLLELINLLIKFNIFRGLYSIS